MAKAKTNYTCTECGGISNKWTGQCPACGQWNTLVETVVEPAGNRFSTSHQGLAQTAPVLTLADIEAIDVPRFGTGIEEFDRVLGGGLVAGGVVLIGGDPGIGKSTLLLQALANLSRLKKVLYVSGEESGAQIALRAKRLAVDARDLQLQAEIQLEKILGTLAEHKPEVAVIDSIQTVYSDALSSAPGSVAQVRECAAQLTRVAKQIRHHHHHGRPRDEGGRAGRTARAGAHRRHRAVFRGRHAFELPPGARLQEPLRRRQRTRRVRDDREGLERACRIRRRCSCRSTTPRWPVPA